MSVSVTHINKYFDTQKALDDVSFEINSGEIAGFIGPNGAGKTTMMRIITGLIPPSSGEAKIAGIDVLENPLEIKKKIGYLPENNPLYKEMYVKEYLLFVAGVYKLGKDSTKKINEIIDITGLEPEKHKTIDQLSKGYRQRVGIAQSLIHDPEVLILDEPTSGLDPNQIIEIRELILQAGKAKTVMLSTHIMQEVEAICDRIIIIDKGKIVANDYKKNILSGQLKNSTIVIEFNIDPDVKVLEAIEGVNKVIRTDNNYWLIQHDAGLDIRNNLFNFAVQNNLSVLSMQKKEKNLEQIFRELTEK
jgi:ABC-2 type transport system ATP-binding protein